MKVFLSYRRADVGGHSGRLADSLARRLGARSVFQDVADIAPGQDFTVVIDRALDECEAVLAVIGPGWLAAADNHGRTRLDQADDYVRRELGQALERDATVVPVLVGGAVLPAADQLPDALRPLAQRQAFTIRDEAWHQDVDSLVQSLRGQRPTPPRRRRLGLLAAVVAVALLVAGGLAFWRTYQSGDPSASSSSLPTCPDTSGPGWTRVQVAKPGKADVTAADGTLTFMVSDAYWRALPSARWEVVLKANMLNQTQVEHSLDQGRFDKLFVARRPNPVSCFENVEQGEDGVTAGHVGDVVVGFRVTCAPAGYLQLRVDGEDELKGDIDVTSKDGSTDC